MDGTLFKKEREKDRPKKGEVYVFVRWFGAEPTSDYYSGEYSGNEGCDHMVMSWAGPSKSCPFRFSLA